MAFFPNEIYSVWIIGQVFASQPTYDGAKKNIWPPRPMLPRKRFF